MEQTLQILTPSQFLPLLPFLFFFENLGREYSRRGVLNA